MLVCRCRLEANLRCPSSDALCLVFEAESLSGLETSKHTMLTGQRSPPFQCWDYKHPQPHLMVTGVLGFRLGLSHVEPSHPLCIQLVSQLCKCHDRSAMCYGKVLRFVLKLHPYRWIWGGWVVFARLSVPSPLH